MDLLAQSALAWLVLWAFCTLGLELLLSFLAPRLHDLASRGRVGIVAGLCWLSAVIASVVLLGCYSPWAAAALGFGRDHCTTHGGHVHLCVLHVHAFRLGAPGWGVLLGTGAWLTIGVREVFIDLRRGRVFLQSLHACSEVGEEDGVVVVDADVPWSVTTGLFHPQIMVTSSLLERFSPCQREAVLAHERCHVKERHGVIKLVAALGASVLLPSTRRKLLDALTLACERRSDEHAAAAIGDRLEVAATLLAARRALADRLPLGVLGLHGVRRDLEVRVRGLVDAQPAFTSSVGAVTTSAVSLTLAALVLGHELHHEVETLLTFLLH